MLLTRSLVAHTLIENLRLSDPWLGMLGSRQHRPQSTCSGGFGEQREAEKAVLGNVRKQTLPKTEKSLPEGEQKLVRETEERAC